MGEGTAQFTIPEAALEDIVPTINGVVTSVMPTLFVVIAISLGIAWAVKLIKKAR